VRDPVATFFADTRARGPGFRPRRNRPACDIEPTRETRADKGFAPVVARKCPLATRLSVFSDSRKSL